MKGVRPRRGRIQIRYKHRGQQYEDTLDLEWTDTNVAEADRIRAGRLARVKRGLPPVEVTAAPEVVSSGLTFAQVAQEYLDRAIDEAIDEDDPFRLKRSTRDGYRDLLNVYWQPSLAKRPIDAITVDDLRAAVRGVKWKTKRKANALGALRQVFAWAEHEDGATGKVAYIKSNPAHTLAGTTKKKRRPKKKPAPDKYTAEGRDKLLAWLKTNAPIGTYAFYLVAFYSGARTGELLALTWEDYEIESCTFSVNKARVRSQITSTKTEETRTVQLPAWVCSVINTLPSRFRKKEIFLNGYGQPYMRAAHLTEYFERAHEKTGVRRSKQPNYPWRHTYASIGLTNGLEPAFLAKQLGHTLAVFYSTYAAWIDSDTDREKIERVFAEPKSGPKVVR